CVLFRYSATPALCLLSLHDALPIFGRIGQEMLDRNAKVLSCLIGIDGWIVFEKDRQRLLRILDRPSPSLHRRFDESLGPIRLVRSEEHTSELQSLAYLVCRLLLEKK